MTAERKLKLFKGIRGSMLEIGAGTGVNFAFIPAGVHRVRLDPNRHSLGYIREAAHRSGLEFDFRQGSAESLPFPDASFDFALSTLALCSVRDPSTVELEQFERKLTIVGPHICGRAVR